MRIRGLVGTVLCRYGHDLCRHASLFRRVLIRRSISWILLALMILAGPAVVIPDAAPQVKADWYYTTSNGVWTYIQVWHPLPPGSLYSGYWEPYDIGVYIDPVSTPLGFSHDW